MSSEATVGQALRLWPPAASRQYVEARLRLLEAERRLSDRLEEVASLRRALPRGARMPHYVFEEGPLDLDRDEPVATPALVDLFGRHRTLLVYHLMFAPEAEEACPMCSMWVDGLHGVSHHLARHVAFAVVAKAPLARLRDWGRRRGWNGLRLLSSGRTTFNPDLKVEDDDGEQRPGVSLFVREGGDVRHSYTMQASFGHDDSDRGIDLLSPVWQVLDLLPQGRGAWYAGNDYAGRDRGDTSNGGRRNDE